MDWTHAQSQIRTKVKVGANLNSPNSTFRFVKQANADGFVVSIGKTAEINIPWQMLRACYDQLQSPSGYSGAFFRKRFPRQASNHPCHVHVVGQIFVSGGLAFLQRNTYLPQRNKR